MKHAHENSSPAAHHKDFYSCVMHPEIRREQPGSCPKCGMALVKIVDTAPGIRIEYVCPMHPEIVRNEPGSCPKCGMALEPREITGGEEENHELADMSRRFWISSALSIPVFIMAMAHDLMPELIAGFLAMHTLQWIEFALATPVVLWGGGRFFSAVGLLLLIAV